MVDLVKRILAVGALLCFAAFIVITVWLICTGKLAGNIPPVLIPLAGFLSLGLLSLAIRWLQRLKQEELEKARQQLDEPKE